MFRYGFVLLVAAAACHPTPDPPPPLPDGGCPAMCSHLRSLGCKEGQPTPGGKTCEEVCSNAATQGIDVTCDGGIAAALSCESARVPCH